MSSDPAQMMKRRAERDAAIREVMQSSNDLEEDISGIHDDVGRVLEEVRAKQGNLVVVENAPVSRWPGKHTLFGKIISSILALGAIAEVIHQAVEALR